MSVHFDLIILLMDVLPQLYICGKQNTERVYGCTYVSVQVFYGALHSSISHKTLLLLQAQAGSSDYNYLMLSGLASL